MLDLQEPPVVSFDGVLFVVAGGSESRVDSNTRKRLFCFVEMLVLEKASLTSDKDECTGTESVAGSV